MKPARILIVEDDLAVARDIRRHLGRLGHSVVGHADSGPDAIRMAAELPVDLILMDIKIEGAVDGIEAAREIRARRPIPIVYLTAYADDATLRRASLTEPAGFLLKPFEELHLRTAVELALLKAAGEERLRQSENRYAVTLSSIGDAVISCDENLLVTFMNSVASSLTGWPLVDALGRPLGEVFRIINEETGEPAEDPATQVLRIQALVGLAHHTALVARDGRVVPIDDCASPILDERGVINGVVLVFRDMTQRRQAEEAETLRTLNERIDQALRGSSLGVWVNEMPDGDATKGRISCWNLWEHLGYPRQDQGEYEPWAGLLHPDDRPMVAAARDRYLRGETPMLDVQVRLRAADGSYRVFICRGAVTRNAQGTPIRFAGTSVDITDRRLMEEALRVSEHRFRTFVEHATDGFILYDSRATILDVNSQVCRSLGYSAEELIGKKPTYVMPRLTQEELDGFLERLARGELVTFGSHLRRKDGSEFPVDLRARQFSEGDRTFIVATVRDVTEREAAEKALRESEARYRGTFDNAGVGIVHADLEGRYLRVNQKYCDILGYDWDDALEDDFPRHHPPR